MQALSSSLKEIIQGEKQFIVPLFQRTYCWKETEWQTLWDDLLELCDNHPNGKNHFIGSIVTLQVKNSVLQSIAKFLLIDGQQRLTTLFILLALLSNKTDNEGTAKWIHGVLLVNQHREGQDFFKLQPTQIDREAFNAIILHENYKGSNSLIDCYRFFERKLFTKKVDINTLKDVIAERLSIVGITLDSDDNPYLVFEGLNAKGRPLTSADLIRNYFFMQIDDAERQKQIYAEFWLPMQEKLGDDLAEFIRHYLIMINCASINKDSVYSYLKDYVAKKDVLAVLKEIATFASHYSKLVDPSNENDASIGQAIFRLNCLEVTTTYPFLLACYDDYFTGKLKFEEFKRVLHILENFTIRRVICGVTQKAFNAIFPNLYRNITQKSPHNFINGLCDILQVKGYPTDDDFRDKLINTDLYSDVRRKRSKTKLLLESLEQSFEHKENVDFRSLDLTIEHIMPKTISKEDWWTNHLGEYWQDVHESCLHTLGNLTLTAYNAELSNSPFPTKQEKLLNSHLELNRYFKSCSQWKREDIEQRSNVLAERALKVWPYFGNDIQQNRRPSPSGVTKTKPKLLKIQDKSYHVKKWRDLLIKASEIIAESEPELFEQLHIDSPSFIHRSETRCRAPHKLTNGMFVETARSAQDIYRFCLRMFELAGLSPEDYSIDYS